jgi:hypothetical protein
MHPQRSRIRKNSSNLILQQCLQDYNECIGNKGFLSDHKYGMTITTKTVTRLSPALPKKKALNSFTS